MPLMSEKSKRKADEEFKNLESWNERFLGRVLVYQMFGRHVHAMRLSYNEDETSNDTSMALKKVERLRALSKETLDRAASRTETLLIQENESQNRVDLPFSTFAVERRLNPSHQSFLVEYRIYSDGGTEREIKEHRRAVRDIAAILKEADPLLMGLMQCSGFRSDPVENRFELQYPFPPRLSQPGTLLGILSDISVRESGPKQPLNQRISLVKSIASALFFLHSAGLVHKQVRPETIVIFEESPSNSDLRKQKYPYAIGRPFLVGFDSARKVDAASAMLHVADWKKSLHLSPQRHRLQSGDKYRMQHDIYSLGVIFLEIAFWTSFQDERSTLNQQILSRPDILKPPEELQKLYLKMASVMVPWHMGHKYSAVAQACLTGLQEKLQNKSLEDADGLVLGTAYVTEIVKRLEEISL